MKKTLINFSFAVIFLSLASNLFAQQFVTKYYTEEEGLPDGVVNDISQDNIGRIWFATRSGLGIFDGTNWTYHNNSNGLKFQNILRLQFDSLGRPWILTSGNDINIFYMDGGQWKEIAGVKYNQEAQLKLTCFNVQIVEDDFVIFVGTKLSGLFVYRNGYWSNYTDNYGLPSLNIQSIEFYNNKFYVGTSKGAVTFDLKMNLRSLRSLESAGSSILLFKVDSDPVEPILWVMGNESIGYITDDKFTRVTPNNAYAENINYYFANLVPNYYNSVIYSYSQSFILYDRSEKRTQRMTMQSGLPQIGATKIFLDREMNLWITSMRGVAKIPSMRFANYNKSTGLYKDEVTAIDEIKKGELILAHNNGFSFFTDEGITHLKINYPYSNNFSFNRVLDVAVDGKGNAYFAAAETGFGKIDENKNITWLNKSNLNYDAQSIEYHKGEVYCLTLGELFKYESGLLQPLYSFGARNINARKIFFDEGRGIYIATMNKGLAYSADYKDWKYFSVKNNKEINNVYSFYIDDEKGKLIGTEAGLYTIEDDSLKKYSENNFEISRPVYFIARDTLNSIWFGTNNGVIKWDGTNQRSFTRKTGLIGYETNRDAGFLCSKGCVWIGTDKGVSRYQSKYDDLNIIAPPIAYLDSIKVDNLSYPGSIQIDLPFSNNNLTFDTKVISYIAEDDNILSYKLIGFDKEWQNPLDASARHIRYTNLPSGEYYLSLKAINALGQPGKVFMSGKILIEKPYYKTTWFYLGLIIVLAFIVFIGFKQFERIHYSQKLEKEVKARTLELYESEKKYKTLLSNLQDGFFVVQEGIIKLANVAMARMLGYELNELLFMRYENVIAPEDQQMLTQRYEARQAGKDIVHEYEFRLLHKNGSRVFVNMNVNISLFEGKIATVGTIKDITEKKRAEELLKKLSTAVKQSPNIVIITDQYGVVEYVNPTFTEVSGYTFDEVKNRNINIVKSGMIDNRIYDEMWETIRKGELWRGELVNRKKDGEYYWVRATISPIINIEEKKTTHYLATQEDITFEKYANEEIQKGEALINTVLNNVPVMIFAFDKEAKVTLVKGKILETLGFTQNNVLGKSAFTLFSRISGVSKDLKRALNGDAFTSVARVNRHTFEVTYTPMFSANGIYSGSLGVAYNITDRKKYERELIKAKDDAEKSDRLKSEFLAQMSHEIRTPINSILSFTTLLKEELRENVSEDLADGFVFIENGAKRLIRTIDLILNMSQVQTGTYQPYYSELDIDKDILCNIITEFKGVASGKKIDLVYNVESSDTLIKGDSYTLGQIFANLVDNAIKYTPTGKVEVEITRPNGKLVVKVSDTGIGISSEFIPILFTPFTQEESGYTRKFEGNGLGLALVKKYIEMNRADIKVESEKGKGTSFIVSFNGYH